MYSEDEEKNLKRAIMKIKLMASCFSSGCFELIHCFISSLILILKIFIYESRKFFRVWLKLTLNPSLSLAFEVKMFISCNFFNRMVDSR